MLSPTLWAALPSRPVSDKGGRWPEPGPEAGTNRLPGFFREIVKMEQQLKKRLNQTLLGKDENQTKQRLLSKLFMM